MSKLAEAVSIDGEVISLSESNSPEEFEYKILNSLDPETVKSFFIKKLILDAVRKRHKMSNGDNGVTAVEMMNLLSKEEVQPFIKELQEKKVIRMKKGINNDMYFLFKKVIQS